MQISDISVTKLPVLTSFHFIIYEDKKSLLFVFFNKNYYCLKS